MTGVILDHGSGDYLTRMFGSPVHSWKIGLACLAATTAIAQAGEIYKSVDADGNVVYSDHADPQATLMSIEDPRYPPRKMHVCGTKNCFTLLLDNGSYRREDGTDDAWTIETFTAKAAILHRHGVMTGNTDVTYSGEVVDDRLVNVSANGNPMGGIAATWGAALDSLPGSNAERDAMVNAPSSDAVSTASTPPPLPEEEQSEVPEPGYLWNPGYWYWRDPVYFWIPGAWVRPPQIGFLWTPAYWARVGTVFVFHPGHWGPTVGFYGGINYGHGYFGSGYTGGRWVGGSFVYNSSVNHLSAAIKNTYAEPPLNAGPRNPVSYDARTASVSADSSAAPHQTERAIAKNPAKTTTALRNSTSLAARSAMTDKPVVVATNASADATPASPAVAVPRKPSHTRPLKAQSN